MKVLRWFGASPTRETVAVAVVALAVLVVGSGWTPVVGRDEARFAQAAREMLDHGEWVVPTFAGVDRYDKPILIYWCAAASYAVFGVSEQAARLPANLAGALVILLLARSARRRWGAGAGALAGLLLLATPVFHVQARACTADMVMMLPTLAAALALEKLWVGDGSRRHALVLWLGLGAAVLAKGPVGPGVLLATVVGVWALERSWPRWQLGMVALLVVLGWWKAGPAVLLAAGSWATVETLRTPEGRRRLRRLEWRWGVPLLLALVLPWAIAAWIQTDGEFLRVAVGRHVVARSLVAFEGHAGFPGFYLLTGLVGAAPWFALLIPAIQWRGGDQRSRSSARFHTAWLLAPLLMFEVVATKLSHYWMPSYPAGVLLVVGWLLSGAQAGERVRAAARVLAMVGLAVLAVLPMIVVLRLELEGLAAPAVVVAAPLLAALPVVASGRFPSRRRATAAAAATLVFMALLVGLFAPGLGRFLLGPRAARAALEQRRPGEAVVVHKSRDDELFFYLPLATAASRSRADLVQRLTASGRFLAIAREEEAARVRAECPQAAFEIASRIDGVDLAKGRWACVVLLRPARR